MEEDNVPQNEDPAFVTASISMVLEFLQQYGWFVIIGAALVAYLYNKYRPQLDQWREQRENDSYKKIDAGVALSRIEAMERARQKMQAQLDEQARQFAEKQKQKEEEKRQARLDDWEKHQQGKGYRSKIRPQEDQPSTRTVTSQPKPKPKKTLRPEYNPLMGDVSGGACFRPARRGGASGGG